MSLIRIERKYIICFEQYLQLKPLIASLLSRDKYLSNKKIKYPVLSQYFDTKNFEFYNDKINGEFEHIKFRLRSYSDNLADSGFLEIKHKITNKQRKYRFKVDPHQVVENNFFNNEDLLCKLPSQLCFMLLSHQLHPSALVYYEREAFEELVQQHNNALRLRVTFDYNIKAKMDISSEKWTSVLKTLGLDSSFVLMEIKYDREDYPLFLSEIVKSFNLEEISFSKYALAIRSLYQDNFHLKGYDY